MIVKADGKIYHATTFVISTNPDKSIKGRIILEENVFPHTRFEIHDKTLIGRTDIKGCIVTRYKQEGNNYVVEFERRFE